MDGALERDHMVLLPVGGFGVITAVSVSTALIGYSRPWLVWVFATLGRRPPDPLPYGFRDRDAYASRLDACRARGIDDFPLAGSIRYRRWLVLYVGVLFGIGSMLVRAAANEAAAEPIDVTASEAAFAGEIARFTAIAVTLFTLTLMTARMRHSLQIALIGARLRATLSRYFPWSIVAEVARMADSRDRMRD